MAEASLARPESGLNPLQWWAESTTRATSVRRQELMHDKVRAVTLFFEFCGRAPEQVSPPDVLAWQAGMEAEGLKPNTIYNRISRLSAFYRWAMREPVLAERIRSNPVVLVRPRAPRAYQNARTQALAPEQARALLDVIRRRADRGDVIGKRDYALFLLYMMTGMRRREIIQLRWGDVRLLPRGMEIAGQVKGGEYVQREVKDVRAKAALLDYLQSSLRWDDLTPQSPLWVAHDRARETDPGGCAHSRPPGRPKPGRDPEDPLTSHGFVKNLKRYADEAGLPDFHLHQTRHTFAAFVAEHTGSLTDTQEALGHHNLSTTRVYVRRLTKKKDRYSGVIGDEIGAE